MAQGDAWKLRPIQASDGDALHGLFQDPAIACWLRPAGATGLITREACDAIAARKAAHWGAHELGQWLVWDGDELVARGGPQYTVIGGKAEIEAGWAVARRHWGRGIATMLGRRSLEVSAAQEVNGMVAVTRTDNLASRRVMEKLGLTYESALVRHGHPHVLYRLMS